jgi:parvulin-like peptidyl-prolyl isomerase
MYKPFGRKPFLPVFLLCFAAAGCREKEPVLARVGSETITEAEFRREAARQPFSGEDYLSTLPGRKEFLEVLIRRKLLMAEARRARFDESEAVRRRLQELEDDFRRQLAENRERVVMGEFLRSIKDKDLAVTDEEVKDFWFRGSEIRAGHILFSSSAAARDAAARLAKGEKFETLARLYSEDKATAAQGGDLGYFMRGTLVPEFEEAAFGLKTGETSGVVSSPYGRHIIRKTGERPLSARPFEQVREPARAVLEKRKFQSWIDAARGRHKIFTDVPALEGLALRPPEATQN